MYPLTRKNTKTPYWPRSSQRYRKSLTGSSISVDPWSNTTQSAANPRSASSHASRLCFGAPRSPLSWSPLSLTSRPTLPHQRGTAPGSRHTTRGGTVAGTERDG